MKILPEHLAECLPQLEALNELLVEERTAILEDRIEAIESLSSRKSQALKALASRVMALGRQTAPLRDDPAGRARASALLRAVHDANRANGQILNIRSLRKQTRLAQMTDTVADAYGRRGGYSSAGSSRRWAVA